MSTEIRKALTEDIAAIKELADAERYALGFVTRGIMAEGIRQGRIYVALVDGRVRGFQHYYHRKRDRQTTLYQKAVHASYRRRGLARRLVEAVIAEARVLGRERIRLKCPTDLDANAVHAKLGFTLIGREPGRRRLLNIWEYKMHP